MGPPFIKIGGLKEKAPHKKGHHEQRPSSMRGNINASKEKDKSRPAYKFALSRKGRLAAQSVRLVFNLPLMVTVYRLG